MERQLFADLVESDGKGHNPKRGLFFTVSLALHVIGLLAVVIVPLLQAQELPEPASAVKAFFVEPAAAPPPPPPPPPPGPEGPGQGSAEAGSPGSQVRRPGRGSSGN